MLVPVLVLAPERVAVPLVVAVFMPELMAIAPGVVPLLTPAGGGGGGGAVPFIGAGAVPFIMGPAGIVPFIIGPETGPGPEPAAPIDGAGMDMDEPEGPEGGAIIEPVGAAAEFEAGMLIEPELLVPEAVAAPER